MNETEKQGILKFTTSSFGNETMIIVWSWLTTKNKNVDI